MSTKNTQVSKPKNQKQKTKKQGELNKHYIRSIVFTHILHGQLFGTHYLIFLLKANKDDFCFISSSTIFQIFGPKYEAVSCPFHTVFTDG